MEVKLAGYTFFSNFESGNLNRVELVEKPPAVTDLEFPEKVTEDEDEANNSSDPEFNMWTKPDCAGTEFENGNRTWFYFGVTRSQTPGVTPSSSSKKQDFIRLTFRNLNKQAKLFSQGMAPIFILSHSRTGVTVGNSFKWERLRERPTYWSEDSNFVLSFRVKIDPKCVTYLAFTYPYTYRECLGFLSKFEKRFDTAGAEYEALKAKPPTSIYFHRETACLSYEGRKMDLLTLTSTNGILPEREPGLKNLFTASKTPRPFKFSGKKVIFISARVHPGETQSSFVFNGLLKFLLRETDPRSVNLRKKYVFKLIPMLNPDGVVRGHYRTDLRGVNLNRVYSEATFGLHPTIYAARKLILYAHYGYEVFETEKGEEAKPKAKSEAEEEPQSSDSEFVDNTRWLRSSLGGSKPQRNPALPGGVGSSSAGGLLMPPEARQAKIGDQWYEMTETSRCSEGDESVADFSVLSSGVAGGLLPVPSSSHAQPPIPRPQLSPSVNQRTSFSGAFSSLQSSASSSKTKEEEDPESGSDTNERLTTPTVLLPPPPPPPFEDQAGIDFAEKLKDTLNQEKCPKPEAKQDELPKMDPSKSGLFMYVDIHGHASKRGVFMYGNHFRDLGTKVETMLVPKLMSINCANFDFPACNFTEKNMYMKDRHTGAGKEGSGRVSVFKTTDLVYCYTLECNFNSGRVVNAVPAASRDSGRATPPPPLDTIAPKYDPVIYEDVGKALATSILDLTESNPWSRLTCSPFKNLKGVKDDIRRHIKQLEEQQKQKAESGSPRKKNRTRNRTTSSSSTAVAGGIVKRGAKTRKNPLSPEAYRPVSKVPRKNSVVARNLQQQLQQQGTSTPVGSPPGSLVTENKKGRKKKKSTAANLLKRSKSIPAVPSTSLLPLLKESFETEDIGARVKRKGQKSVLTRSLSHSTPSSRPASRPPSPTRRMLATTSSASSCNEPGLEQLKKVGIKKKGKVVKKKLPASRKSSLTSGEVTGSAGVSTSSSTASVATALASDTTGATPKKKKKIVPKKRKNSKVVLRD